MRMRLWMEAYDLAVVRGVAASLPDSALRQSGGVAVDFQTAVQQHSEYTRVIDTCRGWTNFIPQVLREELGLEVVCLPADNLLPDCVFVEDVAVVADGVALVTIPGILYSSDMF